MQLEQYWRSFDRNLLPNRDLKKCGTFHILLIKSGVRCSEHIRLPTAYYSGFSTNFRIAYIISHRKSPYLWVIIWWFGKVTRWSHYWFIWAQNFRCSERHDPMVTYFWQHFGNFYKYRSSPLSTINALTGYGQQYDAPILGQYRGNCRRD